MLFGSVFAGIACQEVPKPPPLITSIRGSDSVEYKSKNAVQGDENTEDILSWDVNSFWEGAVGSNETKSPTNDEENGENYHHKEVAFDLDFVSFLRLDGGDTFNGDDAGSVHDQVEDEGYAEHEHKTKGERPASGSAAVIKG